MTVKILCSGLYIRVANPNIPRETGNGNREMRCYEQLKITQTH